MRARGAGEVRLGESLHMYYYYEPLHPTKEKERQASSSGSHYCSVSTVPLTVVTVNMHLTIKASAKKGTQGRGWQDAGHGKHSRGRGLEWLPQGRGTGRGLRPAGITVKIVGTGGHRGTATI